MRKHMIVNAPFDFAKRTQSHDGDRPCDQLKAEEHTCFGGEAAAATAAASSASSSASLASCSQHSIINASWLTMAWLRLFVMSSHRIQLPC